jgi:hypothetical protein
LLEEISPTYLYDETPNKAFSGITVAGFVHTRSHKKTPLQNHFRECALRTVTCDFLLLQDTNKLYSLMSVSKKPGPKLKKIASTLCNTF